jgi:hypothetical protein
VWFGFDVRHLFHDERFWFSLHDEADRVPHGVAAIIPSPTILPHFGEWLALASSHV